VWVHIALSVLVSLLGVFNVVRSPFELCMRSVMKTASNGHDELLTESQTAHQ